MWTLIKREFEEIFYAVIAVGGITTLFLLLSAYKDNQVKLIWCFVGFIIVALILCAIGSNRMIWDKTHGVSVFYTSHLATRGQIFAARLLMGLLLIAIYCIPVGIWTMMKMKYELPIYNMAKYPWDVFRLMAFEALTLLGCYAIGLKMGLAGKKSAYIIGTLILTFLLLSAWIICGFQYGSIVTVLVLDAALLYSCRHEYSAMAL